MSLRAIARVKTPTDEGVVCTVQGGVQRHMDGVYHFPYEVLRKVFREEEITTNRIFLDANQTPHHCLTRKLRVSPNDAERWVALWEKGNDLQCCLQWVRSVLLNEMAMDSASHGNRPMGFKLYSVVISRIIDLDDFKPRPTYTACYGKWLL